MTETTPHRTDWTPDRPSTTAPHRVACRHGVLYREVCVDCDLESSPPSIQRLVEELRTRITKLRTKLAGRIRA